MILKLFTLFAVVLLLSGAVTYVIIMEGFLIALATVVVGGAALTALAVGLFHESGDDWV